MALVLQYYRVGITILWSWYYNTIVLGLQYLLPRITRIFTNYRTYMKWQELHEFFATNYTNYFDKEMDG